MVAHGPLALSIFRDALDARKAHDAARVLIGRLLFEAREQDPRPFVQVLARGRRSCFKEHLVVELGLHVALQNVDDAQRAAEVVARKAAAIPSDEML